MKELNLKITLVLVVFFALSGALFYFSFPVTAGTLTNIKDSLNRQVQNLTSGVVHTLVFTTELAVSGGAGNNQLRIEFPIADDNSWCRAAGALVVTGCVEDGANPLSGTLSAVCTQADDKITITGVDNLLAATKYCVRIDDSGAGDLGTPANTTTGLITVTTNNGLADIDSMTFAVDIVTNDQIAVMAQVGTPSGSSSGGGSGGPAPTEAVLTGKSYPNRPVTLLKNAQVVSSVMADANGNFEIKLHNIAAGQYIFSIYAEDPDGRKSPLLSFSVIIYQNITTYIGGIYIGPTINTDKVETTKGGQVSIFGYTVPNTDVTIYLNSNNRQFLEHTYSDNNGKYQSIIDASLFGLGKVIIFVRSYYQNVVLGDSSKTIDFVVGIKDVFRKGSMCPEKGDLNHDCLVDLVDVSILIFWIDKSSPPVELDFNKDGIIDIVDFSILTYYWTG